MSNYPFGVSPPEVRALKASVSLPKMRALKVGVWPPKESKEAPVLQTRTPSQSHNRMQWLIEKERVTDPTLPSRVCRVGYFFLVMATTTPISDMMKRTYSFLWQRLI